MADWRFTAVTPGRRVFHSPEISSRLDYEQAKDAAHAWFEDGEPRLKPGRYTLITERSADLDEGFCRRAHGRDRE